MVRAKFKVTAIESTQESRGHYEDKDGNRVSGYGADRQWVEDSPIEKRTVKLSPVYSSEEGTENKKFWDATPSGSMELGVINQEAWKHFVLGGEYYVDFVPAD